jgi:hypothetical protein
MTETKVICTDSTELIYRDDSTTPIIKPVQFSGECPFMSKHKLDITNCLRCQPYPRLKDCDTVYVYEIIPMYSAWFKASITYQKYVELINTDWDLDELDDEGEYWAKQEMKRCVCLDEGYKGGILPDLTTRNPSKWTHWFQYNICGDPSVSVAFQMEVEPS